MLLYAITGRHLLRGSESEQREELVALAHKWARAGVDYIQLREKDLPDSELLELAGRIVAVVRQESRETRILVNGPAEIALEAGADGVHLTGSARAGAEEVVRMLYRQTGREPVVSRACHSVEEVRAARSASLIVFAPVFEKVSRQDAEDGQQGVGLGVLFEACRAADPVPVIALGGLTSENAAACISEGAAGVAGIRLFLHDDWQALR